MCEPRFINALQFEDDGGFPFTLVASLTYVSRVYCTFVIPAGFKTDLASIPRPLWNVLPPVGKYDAPAVVHDFLYKFGSINGTVITRGDADRILLEAMTVQGVSWFTRMTVYAGVRIGGWRPWNAYRKS